MMHGWYRVTNRVTKSPWKGQVVLFERGRPIAGRADLATTPESMQHVKPIDVDGGYRIEDGGPVGPALWSFEQCISVFKDMILDEAKQAEFEKIGELKYDRNGQPYDKSEGAGSGLGLAFGCLALVAGASILARAKRAKIQEVHDAKRMV